MVMGVLPSALPRRPERLRVRESQCQMTGHPEHRTRHADAAKPTSQPEPDGWADFFDRSAQKPKTDMRFLELFEDPIPLTAPPLQTVPQCHVMDAFALIRSLNIPHAHYVEIIDSGAEMDDGILLEGRIVGMNRQI